MSGSNPFSTQFSPSFGQPPDAFQLNLFNNALRLCGQTRLVSLTDTQEAQYLLTDAWNDGVVIEMLEEGLWYFAKRTVELTFDATITPNFGYACAFQKPTDWVRTMAFCSDERFNVPITQMSDEAGYFYCDLQTVFVAYVSSDDQFGAAYSRWPPTFYNAVGGRLAEKIVWKLTGDVKKMEMVLKESKRRLDNARSKAAINESAAFFPLGTWVRARMGNRTTLDQGDLNSFYG
jgi:hypothetical protein